MPLRFPDALPQNYRITVPSITGKVPSWEMHEEWGQPGVEPIPGPDGGLAYTTMKSRSPSFHCPACMPNDTDTLPNHNVGLHDHNGVVKANVKCLPRIRQQCLWNAGDKRLRGVLPRAVP
ncbi:hypothetical protein GCM10027072_76070 [Streptomyces bullii]